MIIHNKARWYEHGKKDSKYFYNLEKTNQRKKHTASLKINNHAKLTDPKEILEEEERFFKHSDIYIKKHKSKWLGAYRILSYRKWIIKRNCKTLQRYYVYR